MLLKHLFTPDSIGATGGAHAPEGLEPASGGPLEDRTRVPGYPRDSLPATAAEEIVPPSATGSQTSTAASTIVSDGIPCQVTMI